MTDFDRCVMLKMRDGEVDLRCQHCEWTWKLLDKHTSVSLSFASTLARHVCNRDAVYVTRPHAKMPDVVYGAGHGQPQEDVRVTSTLLITDVHCRWCGEWVETWLPEDRVEKDADGYSVPPEHECEESK